MACDLLLTLKLLSLFMEVFMVEYSLILVGVSLFGLMGVLLYSTRPQSLK
jgi:hypothetical protein